MTARPALVASLLLPLAALAAMREKLGFDPVRDPDAASSAYIAPENQILYRMRHPDGTYREFQHDFAHPGDLFGAYGWRGRARGDRIVIKSGPLVEGGPAEFVFQGGRLVSFRQGTVSRSFDYASPRSPAGRIAPYFQIEEGEVLARHRKGGRKAARAVDRKVSNAVMGKWKKSGRLQWPFVNPNENGFLFASLALLSVLLLVRRQKALRIAGGAAFAVFAVAMVLTASRGAFLSFAVGLLPVVVLRFKTIVRSRAIWSLAAVILVAAAAWFLTHEAKLLTRGFSSGSSWSNETRLEMWRAAPAMMVEAPGGWGIAAAGGAFMDWYQSLDVIAMPGSLINDHLTILVGLGWFGRFAYLFAWMSLLGLLAVVAVKMRTGVALGLWLMFAVASWFNPLLFQLPLWIVPVASLALLMFRRPWGSVRWRTALSVVLGAALVSALVLAGVALAGEGSRLRGYPIRTDGSRLLVKGTNPRTWLADDGQAFGGVLSCKEIRAHYANNPHAPAIGYVRDVKDLPTDVDRLILGGRTGDAWMRMMSEGGAEAQRHLPKEVVFVSPPFPPSALPEGFLKACKVRVLVGEFAALYEPDYAQKRPWVEIVPGVELYFSDWMARTVGN